MEPGAIFTTVLGILNIFRNSLKAFYGDVQDFSNYSSLSDTCRKKLEGLGSKVENWRIRWMIWTDDTELFEWFWGEKHHTVLKDLEIIKDLVEKLEKRLRGRNLSNKNALLRFKIKLTGVAVGKLDHLEKAIRQIDDSITTLNETSDRAFWDRKDRKSPLEPYPSLATSRIHKSGLSRQLVSLALNTYKVSTDLHTCSWGAHQELNMQLEMNTFGSDVQCVMHHEVATTASDVDVSRPGAIAKSMQNLALHYTFLVKDLKRPEPRLFVRIRATIDESLSGPSCRIYFSDAIRNVVEGLGLNGNCGLRLSNNGSRVLIREEVGNIVGYIPDPTPLREVLSTRPAKGNPHFNIIKMRRAFQLAEFGLVFFKTTWIRSVCSCNIHQFETASTTQDDPPYELYRFTLQLLSPNRSHVYPQQVAESSENGVAGIPPCWCRIKSAEDDSIPPHIRDFPFFFHRAGSCRSITCMSNSTYSDCWK
mgnify:CR=1 FL=1